MQDITSTNLEAAIIDQNAAGAFQGKRYAFVAVIAESGNGWQLGIAVANERGYHPIPKYFEKQRDADEWAARLNDHIGLTDSEACRLIISTMGGRAF